MRLVLVSFSFFLPSFLPFLFILFYFISFFFYFYFYCYFYLFIFYFILFYFIFFLGGGGSYPEFSLECSLHSMHAPPAATGYPAGEAGACVCSRVDCEQSLFFFRFSESNACAQERRRRETRETRACLSRLAPSVTRVAICVSRVLLDGLQKKERLLVV